MNQQLPTPTPTTKALNSVLIEGTVVQTTSFAQVQIENEAAEGCVWIFTTSEHKAAETILRQLKPGDFIRIVGRLDAGRVVIAQYVELLERAATI